MPNTIAENLSRLVTAKTDIANAITSMGGTVAQGDGLEDFASAIAGIPEGAEILDMIAPSGISNNNLKAIFYGGKLFVFGEFKASAGYNYNFTFPKSLQEIGITNNLTGMYISSYVYAGTPNATYRGNITITPQDTTISIYGSSYNHYVIGIFE